VARRTAVARAFRFFLHIACISVVLAGTNCWADLYYFDVLVPYNCGGATICTITDLNNEGQVLGQMAGGGGDNGVLLYHAGSGNIGIGNMRAFFAPWADFTTTGLDINDAGDVLFRGFGIGEIAWGTSTGYGILHPDGTIEPDTTGTMFADWGPIDTQLSNTSGQFIGTVPDATIPGETDWALFTPIPAPEPTSFLLLGTLAVPVLIRFRKRR
jgi:hypothetical protein